MTTEKKESNCKSKRLERLIVELYNNTTLTSSEIGKTIKLSTPTVKKVARQNGISAERIAKRPTSVWLDEARNNKIVEALKRGDKYTQIAKDFGITKQRIYQFAKLNGISRWDENREKFEAIVKEINKDYWSGLSYEELVDKYNMNDESFKSKLKYYGLESLVKRFRDVRNKEITRQYKRMSASAVVRNPNPILNDPTKIQSVGRVYHISTASGFRKHPNIERGVRGIFVDPEVLKIIKARKTSVKKHTNQMIADELNEKGLRTCYGNKFSWHTIQNLWGKYQRQGARKTKIKY